ncbi:hypothetical protein F5Y09DRAFT_40168 [Xylaria sp. FL1042]|nr:hypothetical protein F5Y09DRAFT_40168 [Xylaria sp. FL1042]
MLQPNHMRLSIQFKILSWLWLMLIFAPRIQTIPGMPADVLSRQAIVIGRLTARGHFRCALSRRSVRGPILSSPNSSEAARGVLGSYYPERLLSTHDRAITCTRRFSQRNNTGLREGASPSSDTRRWSDRIF